MEIEQSILNGLHHQIPFFDPTFEGANASDAAGAPRKYRPTLSHREKRQHQKGNQGKSEQTRIQAQSMGKPHDGQGSQNPRDRGYGRGHDIEAAIESHRSEAAGNGNFCTHPRDPDRISQGLPEDPELSGSFRPQPKPRQAQELFFKPVATESK